MNEGGFENKKKELISVHKDLHAQVSKTPKFHPYQYPIIINNNTNTNHHQCHFKPVIEVSNF